MINKQALEIVDSQIEAFKMYSTPTAIVNTQGMLRELGRLRRLLEVEQ